MKRNLQISILSIVSFVIAGVANASPSALEMTTVNLSEGADINFVGNKINVDAGAFIRKDGNQTMIGAYTYTFDGKIGISSTTPSEELSVGDIFSVDATTGNVVAGDVTGLTGIFSGNVGIGTTNPGYKLYVESGTTDEVARFKSTDVLGQILISDDTRSTYLGTSGTKSFFGQNAGLSANNLVIDNTGNVGIGTTNPGAKLEAAKGSIGTYMIVGGDDSSNARALEFISTTTTGVGDTHTLNAKSVSGEMAFAITGEEAMRIDNNGNVGIGTTVPGSTLHIKTSGATQAAIQLESASGASNIRADASSDLLVFNNGGDSMVINGSGNVGIGTTAPAYELHVDDGGAVSILVGEDTTLTTDDTGYRISPWTDNNIYIDTKLGTGGSIRYRYGEGAQSGSTATWMTMDGGNVGIGTTNPLGRLDIKGSGSGYLNGLNIVDNANNAKTSILHTAGSLFLGSATNASGANEPTDFEQRLRIYEPTITATDPIVQIGDPDITILNNGNVGIGTTTPLSKLTVYGGVAGINGGTAGDTNGYSGKFTQIGYDTTLNKGFIQAGNFGTGWTDLVLNPINGNVGIGTTSPESKLHIVSTSNPNIKVTDSTNSVTARIIADDNYGYVETMTNSDLIFRTNQVEAMRINNNGNVGIGTTDPSQKLEVNGDLGIGNNGDGAYIRFQSGSSSVGGYSGLSNPIEFSNIEGSSNQHFIINDVTSASTDPAFGFNVESSPRMTILGNGNVGIGTTNPEAKLTVDGDSATLPATSGSSQSAGQRLRLQTGAATGVLDVGVAGANGMWLQSTSKANHATNYPLLLNPNGGNVGIGTTTPNATLDVNGSVSMNIRTVTANTTVASTDYTILVNPAVNTTITLPAVATSAGRVLIIKRIDATASTVTIDANASETIDGQLTLPINAQYDAFTIQCDGSKWLII